MLYWQSALQGCELQPATKKVNIFRPREPSNIRLELRAEPAGRSRSPPLPCEAERGSAGPSRVLPAPGSFLGPAASGLRIPPRGLLDSRGLPTGARPWRRRQPGGLSGTRIGTRLAWIAVGVRRSQQNKGPAPAPRSQLRRRGGLEVEERRPAPFLPPAPTRHAALGNCFTFICFIQTVTGHF